MVGNMVSGTIFDIKEFSIHDGPGARITVFLKGCPLRCEWCHNPEGLSTSPQLMYKKSLCVQCGRCTSGCEHEECRGLARCIHACPNGCLSVSGQNISAEALAKKLLKNAEFLEITGGGITVSGGEPLMQPQFTLELARQLGTVHKAIQTSGHAAPDTYREVIQAYDYIMQDIKLADPALHKQYTGVSNDLILQNIAYLKTSGKPFVFRIPLIPGITDTTANLTAISHIVGDCPVQLLKYNALAGAKYDMLSMTYSLSAATPSPAQDDSLLSLFANATWG